MTEQIQDSLPLRAQPQRQFQSRESSLKPGILAPATTSVVPLTEMPILSVPQASTRIEPEEVLVADVRGSWTPSQMVERKFLARLGNTRTGLRQAGRR